MATYVCYGGAPVPALQTGHPDFLYLRVLQPVFFGFAPSHFNPVPVAAALRGGTVGDVYSEIITAQGGTSPYTFAVSSGALPTGTTINSSTGAIGGTLTATGTFSFTITVADANGYTGSQAFTIVIAAASGGASNYAYFS
jgi:hypothetical protein